MQEKLIDAERLHSIEVERLHLNELKSTSDQELIKQIEDDFLTNFTYNTLAIDERLTINYEDVKNLIEKRVVIFCLPEREQKEVINHAKAFELINNLVSQRRTLTDDILKDLHELLVSEIFVGGSYRRVNVQIKNSMHQPPDHVKVYDRMKKYFFDLDIYQGNVCQKAALASAGISKIYPFIEGNGRIARLVLNYVLMANGYLPITFEVSEKEEYEKVVNSFKVERSLKDFTLLIENKLLKRYEDYIGLLEKEEH